MASLARSEIIVTATNEDIWSGRYVEAAVRPFMISRVSILAQFYGQPSVIMAVFLFLGAAVFLYIKARQGPGPFLFASIFGCIALDISFTTAVLYPYALYRVILLHFITT